MRPQMNGRRRIRRVRVRVAAPGSLGVMSTCRGNSHECTAGGLTRFAGLVRLQNRRVLIVIVSNVRLYFFDSIFCRVPMWNGEGGRVLRN